ncbi:hypothetical protein H8B09_07540 [Paenibacillus sp. PR3]|uniref:Uncharacterized protein n=1 Tax=Paenibacillus terricola TaxID=2763503 RepID=A0ABR8MRI2_9BACL|nr:hypothetical protein [Paenibacillus terricola]MBD3918598.1 hypothetical protein [Paenibacillus terricola]
MKTYGLVFLITGIVLIALSGLEKIIIYTSLSNRAGDYQGLKFIMPNEIWNIPTLTFIFGIVLIIIGLIMPLWKKVVNPFGMIREANKEFETKYGFNKDNKEQ